jgi:hypothetical protein
MGVMPGGLGPRFALEAGFLILLAAVAAYARLSAAQIIAVMAGAWLLTAIFEVIAARRERLYLSTGWQPRVEEEAPAVAEPEPKPRRSWFRRATETEAKAEAEPEPEAPAPAAPATEDAAPAVEAPAPANTPASTDEATGEFELPAPEPRRWFRRRRAEPPPVTEAELESARPSARHVRLITGSTDAAERETPPPEADEQDRKDADTAP